MASDSIFAWQPPASVADNDDADSTINWSEGQNPSTVNNSARAVMARVSEFLSDLLTLKTTGGTGAAYTVTATQQPASLPNGFTVYLLPHATNTGTCTLNVNGLGAKPLRLTSAANAAAGDIVINKPIHATYYETGNEFLVDAANASGALTDIVGDTTPQLGGPLDTNGQGINESEGAAVASAATPDIWATDGNTLHITGTTQIDNFADAPRIGARRKLVFDGALTLTHGSGITLPGGANITTAAGDMAEVYADAVDAFRVVYTKADGTAIVASSGPSKNYIVNPGMRISQENGTSSSTASGYYPADQWSISHVQDGTLTTQQVALATPGGSENRIRMTVTSADTSIAAGQYAVFVHSIEGLRTADLQWGTANATDVVLRFGFKGPAGTYAVAIRNQDYNRSFVREFTISGGDANTDTLQTLTFPGDTSGTWDKDNTSSFSVIFTFAAGSTYQTTADAWQAGFYVGTSSTSNGIGTTSDVFELFDVGLYADPDSTGVAPRFELPHYDTDLQECMRYYETYLSSPLGGVNVSGTLYETFFYKVRKRVNPSIGYSALYSSIYLADVDFMVVSRSNLTPSISGAKISARM